MISIAKKVYYNGVEVVRCMKNYLKAKDYRKIFFLYGLVYATIPIIIVEILWDCFVPAIFFLMDYLGNS